MDEATQRLYDQGNQARISGDYDTALPLLEAAVKAGPEEGKCWWSFGHALLNTGDFDGGISSFEKAAELEPENLRFLLDLAKSLEMLGEYERAEPHFKHVIELDEASREADEARKSLAYY